MLLLKVAVATTTTKVEAVWWLVWSVICIHPSLCWRFVELLAKFYGLLANNEGEIHTLFAHRLSDEPTMYNSQYTPEEHSIAIEVANRLLHADYLLIDTRSAHEYAGCRVIGSISCPSPGSFADFTKPNFSLSDVGLCMNASDHTYLMGDYHRPGQVTTIFDSLPYHHLTRSYTNIWLAPLLTFDSLPYCNTTHIYRDRKSSLGLITME